MQSLDWYNKNKNKSGNVPMELFSFNFCNKHLCGTILTIRRVLGDYYLVKENDAYWTDEMIEGLAEEETKPKYEDEVNGTEEKIWIYQKGQIIHCPDGYIFKDENGNVINATKTVDMMNVMKRVCKVILCKLSQDYLSVVMLIGRYQERKWDWGNLGNQDGMMDTKRNG